MVRENRDLPQNRCERTGFYPRTGAREQGSTPEQARENMVLPQNRCERTGFYLRTGAREQGSTSEQGAGFGGPEGVVAGGHAHQ